MDPVRKKRVTVAFTGLLLLACVVVVSRSILSRNQTGWAGMVFLASTHERDQDMGSHSSFHR